MIVLGSVGVRMGHSFLSEVSHRISGMPLAATLLLDLVPMVSKSKTASFSILEVIHHGTHEKQLSNLWAWMLDSEGNHKLGDGVQRIFIDEINRVGSLDQPVAYGPYGVRQEQNTSESGESRDVSDIILEDSTTSIVIENYYTSDGHGHDHKKYEKYGTREGRNGIVVLLCETEVRSRLTGGWENASVLVYTRLLDRILELVTDPQYQRQNPEQALFITNVHRHFTKKAIMDSAELIDFVNVLCQSGEEGRYGTNNQDRQAILFGDSLREAAIQRYTESRDLLAKVKRNLGDFCKGTLISSLNESIGESLFGGAKRDWQGKWQYDVSLKPAEGEWLVSIAFGPTAAELVREPSGRLHHLNLKQDFTKLLVYTRDNKALISEVSVADVLEGLSEADVRLRDEVLQLIGPVS